QRDRVSLGCNHNAELVQQLREKAIAVSAAMRTKAPAVKERGQKFEQIRRLFVPMGAKKKRKNEENHPLFHPISTPITKKAKPKSAKELELERFQRAHKERQEKQTNLDENRRNISENNNFLAHSY
ncbi:hypothetical protein PMAYCL1PPCAC_05665, partial [Pristionchus mayeri]